jgi:hypothetical protein
VVLFMLAGSDSIARLGHLTGWSFGIFLSSLIFALASLASAAALWLAPREEVRASVRWYSIVVTAALLMAAAYLAWWGIIGLRTWS